eukprot:4143580-Pleurochrysis_carterae.AAC.1
MRAALDAVGVGGSAEVAREARAFRADVGEPSARRRGAASRRGCCRRERQQRQRHGTQPRRRDGASASHLAG